MQRLITIATLLTLSLVFACADSGPKDAKYWVKKLIEEPKQRADALGELKKFDDPKVVPDLIEALKVEGEHRADVAYLLGRLGDKSAVPALIAGIDYAVGAGRDKESKAKNRANTKIAEALAKLGDPQAVKPLIKLLKSRDNYVQLAAVRSLGKLKATEAVDSLIETAAEHDNNFMVKNAIIALGDIADARAIPVLIKMMFVERTGVSFYREASYALFQIGKPAVPALIEAFNGKNDEVNKLHVLEGAVPAKVSVVLGDIGDPRGLKIIRKIAGEYDPQTLMGTLAWSQACRALGFIGDGPSVKTLVKNIFITDPSSREHPTLALGLIGDRAVVPELFKATQHQPFFKDCKAQGYDDEACKNTEWEARQLSAEWMTRLATGDMLDKYKKMLAAEKDPKVKKMLEPDMVRLEAAKECGDKTDCWLQKLKTQAPKGADRDALARAARIRDKAAFELAYKADPKTAQALLDALQDTDLEARFGVVVALLRLLPKEGADRVAQIIEDERGKSTFIKINEDLKRLEVKMRRGY